MLWAALMLDTALAGESPPTDAASRPEACKLDELATWCLQFTPRVALAGEASVVMEAEASARLFGGRRQLASRVRDEAQALGVARLAWAPTSLAALAFARCGLANGFAAPLHELLDRLPLEALAAAAAHRAILERLGCRTLGQVRALPRGGVARRFDAALLAALDRAYGLRPEVHEWHTAPAMFRAELELAHRVELAPALLFAARRLLLLLCGWLDARQTGAVAIALRWRHDSMRSRSAGDGGELMLRTAEPTRAVEHFARLLAEHLAHVRLAAPVGAIELAAVDVRPLPHESGSLLPDAQRRGEPLALVLERVAARLGPERVLRPLPERDHRPEWMVRWQPVRGPAPAAPAPRADLPQPTYLLAEPLRLAMRGPRPMYQGPLQLLLGPHRLEGGWWHRVSDGEGRTEMRNVARDYWVAASEHAGLLWIFRARLASDDAWFLHGCFA